jgi:hypothetical protein
VIALEQLADGSISDRNFQTLARLVLDTGGLSAGVRFGTGTLTWPGGSPFTNTLPLAHGLGRIPTIAVATATLAAGTDTCGLHVVTFDATNVQWRGYQMQGVSPVAATTKTFYWAVIG